MYFVNEPITNICDEYIYFFKHFFGILAEQSSFKKNIMHNKEKITLRRFPCFLQG